LLLRVSASASYEDFARIPFAASTTAEPSGSMIRSGPTFGRFGLPHVLFPNGGDLVTIANAYFDESYDDAGPRTLCVAGYYFSTAGALEFGRLWSRYLRSKGLPYFHANEAAHRDGVFSGWSNEDIGAVARKLIALTKEYSSFGVACSLDQTVYEDVCQGHRMFPTPYAYALTNCLYGIAIWRERAGRSSSTAFYFEQGHSHADDAHKFLSFMLKGDELPGRIGYRSHAFVSKDTPQVQAGDLLAWLWRLHTGRLSRGDATRPMRKDLQALMRPQDHFSFFDRERITAFRDLVFRHASEAEDHVREIAKMHGLPHDVAEYAAGWMPDYREMRTPKQRVARLRRGQ
jgi:hypothetical protein